MLIIRLRVRLVVKWKRVKRLQRLILIICLSRLRHGRSVVRTVTGPRASLISSQEAIPRCTRSRPAFAAP